MMALTMRLVPACRRLRATVVGPRTFASAWQRIQRTAASVVGGPSCFSDGFSGYRAALSEGDHTLQVFPRPGTRGRPQNPLKEPHPALVDAQGITPKQKGRRQALLDRGRCGAPPLEERGVQRRTRVRERLPRTLRPSLAPLGRKGSSGWKDRAQRRRRIVGFQACDHCVRPPLSLRVPRPVHAQCATGLMRPQWAQRTPGMAAGLTAHVWTVRELLTVKCEPLHSQSNSG